MVYNFRRGGVRGDIALGSRYLAFRHGERTIAQAVYRQDFVAGGLSLICFEDTNINVSSGGHYVSKPVPYAR